MRRIPLRTQLALLLGSLSLLLVIAIMLAVKASFDQGFHDYLNAGARSHYEMLAHRLSLDTDPPDAWQTLASHPTRFHQWLVNNEDGQSQPATDDNAPPDRQPPPRREARNGMPPPDAWGRPPRQQPDRPPRHAAQRRPPAPAPQPPAPRRPPVWLMDSTGHIVAGPPLPKDELIENLQRAPIQNNNGLLGYLAWRPVRALDNEADTIFATRQHQLFAGIAVIAVLLSQLLAWPLARALVNPVQQLSRAMHALTQRRYDTRVDIRARNELGELGRDFNHMAQALGDHDHQQRQWLADASHELRTPLGVMKGELEALQDGLTPMDSHAIQSLQEEVEQLSHLVDDLHQLAITQSTHMRYQLKKIDLNDLLQHLAPRIEPLMHNAGLVWQPQPSPHPLWIQGDAQRLEQLLMNLAQNSVRYTDRGGQVRVSLQSTPAPTLIWEDSAPGVDTPDLEHLFDRFYRVEKSRQRALGGSGLGLAIVANIAHAHQAQLQASHSPLGGLRISLRFKGAE